MCASAITTKLVVDRQYRFPPILGAIVYPGKNIHTW